MRLILALDSGTTSARAILFDEHARQVALAQRPTRLTYPHPGWVEQDPREIWSMQLDAARQALADSDARPGDVTAIGITNQRETTILWDRATGEPVHPAIVWQDRRTAAMCERLRAEGAEDTVRERAGLLLDPYFSATKIAWILDNVPGARRRAAAGELAFGTVETWLIWNLTAGRVHATDLSNASRTALLNIHTGDWDADLLRIFNVPREILPTITGCSGEIARPEPSLGLGDVPIAGAAGDQQAALFGQVCLAPGQSKCTYGTGCFLLRHTGTHAPVSRARLLTTLAASTPGRLEYALEGSVFVGGAVVQWLRDGLGVIKSSDQVEALATSVPDTGGVQMVPAFVGLGAPHWDPHARGLIIGITRETTAAHIARAAIESIAHQVADLAEAVSADAPAAGGEPLRVDGGAARNDALMQFQADLIQAPVLRPRNIETTALGAAFLAGLAAGVWKSPKDLEALWEADRVFEPKMPAREVEARRAVWREAVARSRAWALVEHAAGKEQP